MTPRAARPPRTQGGCQPRLRRPGSCRPFPAPSGCTPACAREVGGGERAAVPQLPLSPCLISDKLHCRQLWYSFPGEPQDQSQARGVLQGCWGPSREGCGPLPLREQSSIPWPAAIQALTISQPPPHGHADLLSLLGGHPGLSALGPACPKVLPPGAINPEWHFPGKPLRFGAAARTLLLCPSLPPGAPASGPHPHPCPVLPKSRCRLLGSSGGSQICPLVTRQVADFPSCLALVPLNLPPLCLGLCAVWQGHFLVEGLVPPARHPHCCLDLQW